MLWHFSYTATSFISLESTVTPCPFHFTQASIFISIFLSPSSFFWINNLPHHHCCSSCQSASSEFNYPTVVLWCCLVSWWRIHYLITPLDKTVTTLSYSSAHAPLVNISAGCLFSPVLSVISSAILISEIIVPSESRNSHKPCCCDPDKNSVVLVEGRLTNLIWQNIYAHCGRIRLSVVCVCVLLNAALITQFWFRLFFWLSVCNVRTVKLSWKMSGEKRVRHNPICVNHKQRWLKCLMLKIYFNA